MNIAAMSGSDMAVYRMSITQWLVELQEEQRRGHVVTEVDSKALEEDLENFLQTIDQVQRVRHLASKLEVDAEKAGGVGIVALAFAQEIRNALAGTGGH